jgi:hypothetical protein
MSNIQNVVEPTHRKITQDEIVEFGGKEGIDEQYQYHRKRLLDRAEREAKEGGTTGLTLLEMRNLDRGTGSGKTGRRFGEKHN